MTSRPAATLRSRYVEQAASDLEENRRRQQELTQKIAVLKQEEALLGEILTLAERYEGFADPSRLPEQSQNETTPTTPKQTPTAPGSQPAAPATTTPAETPARAKPHQPLLGDLLLDLLHHHNEPRSAKELRDELLQQHPDRNPTPQVVRNTLESLVAKSNVQRHKQQHSVMYTPVASARH